MDREAEQRELMNQALQGNDGRTGTIYHEIRDRDKQIKAETQKKEQQSKLQALLLDAQYKAAYDAAMSAFNEAQSAVYDALIDAKNALNQATQHHNQLMERASTYNGVRVFMDEQGHAYTEDGQRLTEEEILDVEWREDAPSYEAFIESRDDLSKKQKRFDTVDRYQNRLDSIHKELNNEDNPPSKERLEELTDELNQITNSANNKASMGDELEIQKPESAKIPELKI